MSTIELIDAQRDQVQTLDLVDDDRIDFSGLYVLQQPLQSWPIGAAA